MLAFLRLNALQQNPAQQLQTPDVLGANPAHGEMTRDDCKHCIRECAGGE
jgi:hypothetical protein